MKSVAIYLRFVGSCLIAAMLTALFGCQHVGSPTTRPALQSPREEAIALIRQFIAEGRAAQKTPGAEALAHDISLAGWLGLAACCGYDLREDYDAWECWLRWVVDRDRSVIHKFLESDEPMRVKIGVDMALDSGDGRDIRLIFDAYDRSDETTKTYVRDTWDTWLEYHAPMCSIDTPTGVAHFKYYVRADDAFWARVVERLGPALRQALDQRNHD